MKWLNFYAVDIITRADYDIGNRRKNAFWYMKENMILRLFRTGRRIVLSWISHKLAERDNDIQTLILDASAACHMCRMLVAKNYPPLAAVRECRRKRRVLTGYLLYTCLAGDIIGDYSLTKRKRELLCDVEF